MMKWGDGDTPVVIESAMLLGFALLVFLCALLMGITVR